MSDALSDIESGNRASKARSDVIFTICKFMGSFRGLDEYPALFEKLKPMIEKCTSARGYWHNYDDDTHAMVLLDLAEKAYEKALKLFKERDPHWKRAKEIVDALIMGVITIIVGPMNLSSWVVDKIK